MLNKLIINMKTKFIIAFLFSLFFISCGGDENTRMERKGFVKAIVINMSLDGCEYVLQLESGEKMEPDDLDEEYRVDGLEVWVKYKADKDKMGACMIGPIVNVRDIQMR